MAIRIWCNINYIILLEIKGWRAKNILTNIRSASNLLEFMSDEYNAVGVKNFTPKANQVLMIRADVDAIIDVNALAAVFNLDKAEFQTRKIMVDNFGEGNDDVYAILCDDEFLQVVNNLDKFTEQYNAQGDYWNYFWHVWRTYAASPFSNVIAFTSGTIVAATGVTITTANGTYPKGTNLQMTATIAPTTATAKGVRWTLEGAEADTYISATGMVHLGKGQTSNLTIKARYKGLESVHRCPLQWNLINRLAGHYALLFNLWRQKHEQNSWISAEEGILPVPWA